MSDNRQEQIRKNLNSQETEELLDVWQNGEIDEWDELVFEIIKEILMERLGCLPPQSIEIQISQILDRVESHLEKNELDKALSECELAIELNPDLAIAYNYRGEIYDEMEQLENAITNYQKAIELDPEYKEAWENLLSVELGLEEEFENSTAKAQLDQALEYANDGEIAKALSECETVKPNMPSIAIAHNYMGLILQIANQLELAIDSYVRAIKLNPRFYAARENLANARVAWEEEQYHLFSNLSPIEEQEIIETDTGKIPESDEPLPQWLYMNEKSFLLMGYPGYRNRQGRSGYDPLERNAEQARMQGIMIHLLLNRKFRTRNPIYLVLMACAGILYFLTGVLPLLLGNVNGIIAGLIYSPYSIVGLMLLVNVYLSLRLVNSDEYEDNGYTFF
ncbi:MAG: tetratricopeptide repeat protein [Anaerolineales bacterium]|nr:tetratricopeptide repeat protein [Anaerolineales bacterium]